MNNKLIIGLAVVGSLVGGIIGAKYFAPLLGGDFAGGVVPSQLWTGSVASNSVSPISSLPNLLVPGAITQTNLLGLNTFLGTMLTGGNIAYSILGWTYTLNASTTLSAGTFCNIITQYTPAGSPAGIVETLPSASSSYQTCGSPASGAYENQVVTNDATNSIQINLGSGDIPRYGYNGSTTIAASTTMDFLGQWTSSTTLEMDIFQL